MDRRTARSAECSKSQALNKVIDSIIEVEPFEQKCVVLKGLLQSERLKQHMITIGVDQLLSNVALYEHRSTENVKELW